MGVNSIARLRPGRGPESMVSERKEKVFIFDYFLFYGNLKIIWFIRYLFRKAFKTDSIVISHMISKITILLLKLKVSEKISSFLRVIIKKILNQFFPIPKRNLSQKFLLNINNRI